jgi:hypothetical protein
MRRFLLIAPLLVAACDRPASPTQPIALRSSANLEAGVVQSATGAAHRLSGDEMFILSFEANKLANGTVHGRYHVDLMASGVSFDVRVTCLSVVDNIAWVGGIIEKVNGPLVREGTVSYFYAIDKGEGEGAPADIVSGIRINDLAGRDEVFCTERPLLLSSRPIEFGNIQVRE